MTITKLLVVVFIAALCDNVSANRLGGMPNDTELMDKKLSIGMVFDGISNSTNNNRRDILGDIINIIIGIFRNNPGSINITIPMSPNNTSPAPSPGGGLVGVAPSPAPEGGGLIQLAPSPLPLGIPPIGAPLPESGAAPDTNDIRAPIAVNIGVAPAPEGGVLITTNNLRTKLIINAKGGEDGSNGGSSEEELEP
ncbi:hypothetical protein EUTSA_v10023815mg [Eutrema salsugineum]|uniref:Uncharacterized protein n=1 Tax=Eutrema salsugineum TaxID=72664 RepID=V4KPB8_EUTSA|nr:uncharacterized protein LOC18010027 [Eutrema salsugineum]ESQ29203.1 hypothetical protein EUTSA_v10023815mg [Eutrema salsugineum]